MHGFMGSGPKQEWIFKEGGPMHDPGRKVLLPSAPRYLNTRVGSNKNQWFDTKNYVNDMGGFIAEGIVDFNFCDIAKTAEQSNSNLDDETAATSIILDMILQEADKLSSDRAEGLSKVFVGGFSQGGAMTYGTLMKQHT